MQDLIRIFFNRNEQMCMIDNTVSIVLCKYEQKRSTFALQNIKNGASVALKRSGLDYK